MVFPLEASEELPGPLLSPLTLQAHNVLCPQVKTEPELPDIFALHCHLRWSLPLENLPAKLKKSFP